MPVFFIVSILTLQIERNLSKSLLQRNLRADTFLNF